MANEIEGVFVATSGTLGPGLEVFRFNPDRSVIASLGPATPAVLVATWAAFAAELESSRDAYRGTYSLSGEIVQLRMELVDRTLNFDWEDRGYYEEDRRIIDCSGTYGGDRLTLDYTAWWEAETFVASPPVKGTIECRRVDVPL
jgi:hypothetical protein